MRDTGRRPDVSCRRDCRPRRVLIQGGELAGDIRTAAGIVLALFAAGRRLAADAFDLVAVGGEFLFEKIAAVALELEDAVFDGAAAAEALF